MSVPPTTISLPWVFWRSFIDSIPAAVAVLDSSLCYVDMSRCWEQVFQAPRQKLIGQQIGSLHSPLALALQSDLRACLAGMRPKISGEFKLTLDGQQQWFSFDAQCWTDQYGDPCGIVIYSRNITRQKRADDLLRASEERFRTLFQYSPVAYLAMDGQGLVVDANDEMGRLLLCDLPDLLGQSLRGWLVQGDVAGLLDQMPHDRLQAELVLRRQDGRERTVQIQGRVQRDVQQNFVRLHCILFDITERQAMAQELERLNRVKVEFLTNMSHELRTPLNAINGFSYMIKEQALGTTAHEKYRDYAAVIYDAGMHLLSLIDDVLDISSLDAGQLALCKQPQDLTALIRSCLECVRNMAENASVTMTADLSQLPHMILDGRRIQQVIINLLTNALRFTPAGGHMRLETRLDSDGFVIISVADTGIGMDDSGIATALEPFGQVETGLQRSHEGLGLGLPLSRRFVELHGGTLSIHSQSGQGTIVEIRLPNGSNQAVTG